MCAQYPIVGVVLFASSMGVYYTYRLLVRTNDVTYVFARDCLCPLAIVLTHPSLFSCSVSNSLDREKRADLFHEQEAYSPHKVRKFSASRALDENNCEIAKPLNSLFVTPRVKGSFGPGTKNS